jgi:hypothetical protein
LIEVLPIQQGAKPVIPAEVNPALKAEWLGVGGADG